MTLPCPECLARGIATIRSRIGSRRVQCKMCNRFAQLTRNQARKELAVLYPEDFKRLRDRAEYDVYALLVEQYCQMSQDVSHGNR